MSGREIRLEGPRRLARSCHRQVANVAVGYARWRADRLEGPRRRTVSPSGCLLLVERQSFGRRLEGHGAGAVYGQVARVAVGTPIAALKGHGARLTAGGWSDMKRVALGSGLSAATAVANAATSAAFDGINWYGSAGSIPSIETVMDRLPTTTRICPCVSNKSDKSAF